MDRVPKEGLQCPLRHGGLRGGVVGVGGGAGEDFLEIVGVVAPFTPSRPPGPFHPAAVVLLGDASCAAMQAGTALRAAAFSAAATAGRMESISLGCRAGGGWLEGPRRDAAARSDDLVGSGVGGRRGAAVSAFCSPLRPAPAMWEGVRFSFRGAEQFAWAAFGRQGGWVWGFVAVCRRRLCITGRVGCAVELWPLRGGCVWVAGVRGR